MNDKGNVSPKIIALKMNETRLFTGLDSRVSVLWSVYLYDETARTFCCEITPSFFLRWVDVSLEFAGEIEDVERDGIYDHIREVYTRNDNDCYMHISTVEKLDHRTTFMEGNDFEPWWKEYDEEKIWDEIFEAYHQCPIF